jgi:hypothetical protein
MEFPERSLQVLHFPEPLLEFGAKQTTAHPKDGLFLYGPHSKPKKAKDIRIGVIGTPTGINHFRRWAAQLKKLVTVPPPGKTEKQDRLHLANFPGLEEAFKISFNESEFVAYTIDLKMIDAATRILNLHEAVSIVPRLPIPQDVRDLHRAGPLHGLPPAPPPASKRPSQSDGLQFGFVHSRYRRRRPRELD